MTGTNSNVKKAMQLFHVVRQNYGYDIIEKASGLVICKLIAINSAPDYLNTMLRDAVVNAYYTYGKNLGMY